MDQFELENWLRDNISIIESRVLNIGGICNYLYKGRDYSEFKNLSILTSEDIQNINNNHAVYPTDRKKWNGIHYILIRKSKLLVSLDNNLLYGIFTETDNHHVLLEIKDESKKFTNANNGGNVIIDGNGSSYEPTFLVPELDPVYFIKRKSTINKIKEKIQVKNSSSSKILIIYGMPGIGKTLILSKFCKKTMDQIKWIPIKTQVELKKMLRHFSNFPNPDPDCTFVLDQVLFDIAAAEHRSHLSSLKCARPVIILSNISPGYEHKNQIKISKMSNDEIKELHKSFKLTGQNKKCRDLEELGKHLGYHPGSLCEAFTQCKKYRRKMADIIEIFLLEPKKLIKNERYEKIFDSFVAIIDNLQSDITKKILSYFGFLNKNEIHNSVLYSLLELEYNKPENLKDKNCQTNFEKEKEDLRDQIVESLDSVCLLEGEVTTENIWIHSILRSVLSVKYLEKKDAILTEFRNFLEVKVKQSELHLSQDQKDQHQNILDSFRWGKIQ